MGSFLETYNDPNSHCSQVWTAIHSHALKRQCTASCLGAGRVSRWLPSEMLWDKCTNHRQNGRNIYNARNCGISIVIKIFLLYFRYFGETFFFAFLCSPFSSYRVLKGRAEYWSRNPAPFPRKSRIPHFFNRFPESFFFSKIHTLKKTNCCKSQ